ncbi:hypothetical protein BC938DRAFT_482692 [Jimgerdemannia flammicorona]|uniref:Methyltransferase domain-containing protein n=1 Tax=Jimgerdemannia flammicorona TaxID=994334 RepID=A0A433QDG3_9FUNG|nr:hypothetical protein BC938DRAFT_482692 [Jimgerdemannia flammicorona]
MATDFPNSKFTGIDTGAFLPKSSAPLPANCEFQASNAAERLPFENEMFDYIFQRHMVASYDTDQWRKVTEEMFRVTKPGGFVEIVELDVGKIVGGGSVAKGAWRVAKAFAERNGMNLRIIHRLPYLMTEAGFIIAKAGHLSIPIGKQGGEIGRLFACDLRSVLQAGKALALRELTISSSFFDDLLNRLFDELDGRPGVFMNVHIAVYQKPSA